MRVKARNLTELIIQGCIFVLLFIPGMYQEEYWRIGSSSLDVIAGGWTHKWSAAISFWNKNLYLSTVTAILLWVFIIVICVAVVLYLLQYIGKKEKSNKKICIIFPIAEMILFIATSLFTETSKGEYGNYSSYFSYSPYILFPVVVALIVALILITSIGYVKAAKAGVIEDNKESMTDDSIADELRKFKELYDEGIISQEEFEQKKEQLLR